MNFYIVLVAFRKCNRITLALLASAFQTLFYSFLFDTYIYMCVWVYSRRYDFILYERACKRQHGTACKRIAFKCI